MVATVPGSHERPILIARRRTHTFNLASGVRGREPLRSGNFFTVSVDERLGARWSDDGSRREDFMIRDCPALGQQDYVEPRVLRQIPHETLKRSAIGRGNIGIDLAVNIRIVDDFRRRKRLEMLCRRRSVEPGRFLSRRNRGPRRTVVAPRKKESGHHRKHELGSCPRSWCMRPAAA